jgi:serine phosphatase RsbU (regulator of sigma subunit)
VVADCTGHGVPGAFVTMIAEGALERAIAGIEPGALGTLVQRTHQLVQAALNQDSEGGDSDDGLELGACYLPDDGGRLKFTGARFDLFTLHNGETEQIKGTKAGLGYRRYDQDQSYEEHDVDIRPGTSCYLTSDGLIDQIGGEKRRSFGKRRFLALLVDLERRPMAEKAAEVEKALIAYQGDNTRRDDITVAGFAL